MVLGREGDAAKRISNTAYRPINVSPFVILSSKDWSMQETKLWEFWQTMVEIKGWFIFTLARKVKYGDDSRERILGFRRKWKFHGVLPRRSWPMYAYLEREPHSSGGDRNIHEGCFHVGHEKSFSLVSFCWWHGVSGGKFERSPPQQRMHFLTNCKIYNCKEKMKDTRDNWDRQVPLNSLFSFHTRNINSKLLIEFKLIFKIYSI